MRKHMLTIEELHMYLYLYLSVKFTLNPRHHVTQVSLSFAQTALILSPQARISQGPTVYAVWPGLGRRERV